jgi:hypothetical protein
MFAFIVVIGTNVGFALGLVFCGFVHCDGHFGGFVHFTHLFFNGIIHCVGLVFSTSFIHCVGLIFSIGFVHCVSLGFSTNFVHYVCLDFEEL